MRLLSKILIGILLFFCAAEAVLNAEKLKNNFFSSISFGTLEKTIEAKNGTVTKIFNSSNKPELYFVGDIMLGRDVERKLIAFGKDYPYKKLSFTNDRAFVVANFESAIPEKHVPAPNNTFRFSVDQNFLPELRAAGFTHLSLANNHSFDYGLAGYNHSVTTLWNSDFVPFGHPSVFSTSSIAILNIKDKKVAVLGLHTLFNNPDSDNLKNTLIHASAISDIQIVYVHWGEEYSLSSSKNQRQLAVTLSDAGADIIIGHHPHVVQNIEKINQTLVFYSLGNYIFDQYFSDSVQNGLALKLTLEDNIKIELLPISSLQIRAQPQLLVDKERENFLFNLAERSEVALYPQIIAGFLSLTVPLASSTEVAIMAQ